ncbi:MAG: hypothetical protein K6G38_06095 [Gammaproteobacteria bacterium]|nr:hypothetical protein [Gammaproteobacteria bacterium]
MKKLKSLFLKIKSKRTIKTYQKPLLFTILSLLLLNVIVLVIASILGVIIDPEYFNHNFFKAFAHALSCMVSANTITKLLDIIDTHLGVVILSAMIIVVEMIIFSGALVATLTTALKAFIDKKSQAKGKIILEDHFVILNYNSKVPDIIYNLIEKGYQNNVIILSNKNKDYITEELNSLISIYSPNIKRKINLIVKEGTPLLPGNLEDISISKASNIIIVSREDMEDARESQIDNSDLNSLKIVLSLGNFNISKDCNIVVETDNDEMRERIESLSKTINSLKDKSIVPVSFNRKLGQIIAQTIINPVMASIYLEILSFEGSEFYSTDDSDVESFLKTHNNAIPIIKYDKLFVLAEDKVDIPLLRKEKIDYRPLKVNEKASDEHYELYIIGTNKKAQFIHENLDLAASVSNSQFNFKIYDKKEVPKLIEDIKKDKGIKKVLILSDDQVSPDSYDANVFYTLIALTEAFHGDENISYVTELLDSRNLNSIKDFNIKNAIISNRMMSLLLSQLSLNQDSSRFFNGLFTSDTEEGGDFFDIEVKKVKNLFSDEQDLSFNKASELIHSFYYSFNKRYMLLGYIHNDEIKFIPKNQDNTPIKLDKEDELFYIKY